MKNEDAHGYYLQAQRNNETFGTCDKTVCSAMARPERGDAEFVFKDISGSRTVAAPKSPPGPMFWRGSLKNMVISCVPSSSGRTTVGITLFGGASGTCLLQDQNTTAPDYIEIWFMLIGEQRLKPSTPSSHEGQAPSILERCEDCSVKPCFAALDPGPRLTAEFMPQYAVRGISYTGRRGRGNLSAICGVVRGHE
ncbi:hypothetical protein C8R44DRAFT_748645 [Mycena epipterygia]|nr:hypothetical protein C8R44DRAFT_748645 [Mycena epipterygia]